MVWTRRNGSTVAALALVAAGGLGLSAGRLVFGLSPADTVVQVTRVVAASALSVGYASDLDLVRERSLSYARGDRALVALSPREGWRRLSTAVPSFELSATATTDAFSAEIPFVYERSQAPHLVAFRQRYDLPRVVASANDEYDAVLKLGGWLGRQFDHGTDRVAGRHKACDPVTVVADGQRGQKYWCEIAALTMVHAATSLGWPARMTTASIDGYSWNHAVAEVWSNTFSKWFVVDTDFNVVYEKQGVPLSAAELMASGVALRESGALTLRRIAPPKSGIPDSTATSTLGLYRYIHVDMRNDWCSRPLRRGSPAGGDRATWWMAQPSFRRLLTARHRVEDPRVFDWPLNVVSIHGKSASRASEDAIALHVAFTAYSPHFTELEMSVDGSSWTFTESLAASVVLPAGRHTIRARVRTASSYPGPVSTVDVTIVRVGN